MTIQSSVSADFRNVGKVLNPAERDVAITPRVAVFFSGAIVLAMVWFAFSWKMWGSGIVLVGSVTRIAEIFTWAVATWVGVLLLVRRRLAWPLVLFLAYLGWTYVRAAMDNDAMPFLITGMALIMVTFFLFDHAQESPTRLFLGFSAAYLVAGLVFAALSPELAFRRDSGAYSDFIGTLPYGLFMGIAPHPNHLGPAMAVGLLIVFAQMRTTVAEKVIAVFVFAALIYTGSDGSYVSVVGALVVMVFVKDFIQRRPGRIPWNSLLMVWILFLVGVWAARLIANNGISSFTTGRDSLWSSFFESSLRVGWLGLGNFPHYIRRYPDLFDEIALRDPNPHNVWLATTITSGYIGLLLLIAFWVSVAFAIVRMPGGPEKTLAIGLSAFLLIHGMVESHIFGGFRIYFVLYAILIGLMSLTYRRRKIRGGEITHSDPQMNPSLR